MYDELEEKLPEAVCKRHPDSGYPCVDCRLERENLIYFNRQQTNRANDVRKAPRPVRQMPHTNGSR